MLPHCGANSRLGSKCIERYTANVYWYFVGFLLAILCQGSQNPLAMQTVAKNYNKKGSFSCDIFGEYLSIVSRRTFIRILWTKPTISGFSFHIKVIGSICTLLWCAFLIKITCIFPPGSFVLANTLKICEQSTLKNVFWNFPPFYEIKTIFAPSPVFVCVKVFNLGSLPLKLNYIVN